MAREKKANKKVVKKEEKKGNICGDPVAMIFN